MNNDIEKILVSEEELKTRIKELGVQLSADFDGKDPLFVGLLKGCVVFFSDMLREITIPCRIDFMSVSSYGAGTETSGEIKIKKDLSQDITGQHIVILEDIVDSGLTLNKVCTMLRSRGAASVSVCSILDKPSRRKVEFVPDYVGFTIPNEFAVGYGLDYNEHYRNLPYVGVLKPEIYTK